MKKILVTLNILILLNSCNSSNKQKQIDDKFKSCYNSTIIELIEKDIFNPIEKSPINKDINELYEKFLVQKKVLKSIEKASYIELFTKLSNNEIKKGYSNQFSAELDFNPEGFFPSWANLICHDKLLREKYLTESHWQYKFAVEIDKYRATGKVTTLVNAINLIPENEFNKIYYRHELINYFYNMNVKNKN
jgi:hypothetical protein